jgi:hypothetical protein
MAKPKKETEQPMKSRTVGKTGPLSGDAKSGSQKAPRGQQRGGRGGTKGGGRGR